MMPNFGVLLIPVVLLKLQFIFTVIIITVGNKLDVLIFR